MKKIFLVVCLVFVSYESLGVAWGITPEEQSAIDKAQSISTPTTLTVEVTEKVPGAQCDEGTVNSSGTKIYKCKVERGFGTVQSTIGAIIKYFTYITGLAGVLYIIINGIMLSMSGLEQSMKDTAKKHIQKVLIGLLLLLLSGVILNLIAPWIYQ